MQNPSTRPKTFWRCLYEKSRRNETKSTVLASLAIRSSDIDLIKTWRAVLARRAPHSLDCTRKINWPKKKRTEWSKRRPRRRCAASASKTAVAIEKRLARSASAPDQWRWCTGHVCKNGSAPLIRTAARSAKRLTPRLAVRRPSVT